MKRYFWAILMTVFVVFVPLAYAGQVTTTHTNAFYLDYEGN